MPFHVHVLDVRACRALPHQSPRQHVRRLGVEVELTASRVEPLPANYYYGVLEDTQGASYRSFPGGCRPYLNAAPLSAGDTVRGFVNFEVPEGATGLRFRYAPRLQDGKSAPSAAIELDR
jgi:hypothetical protein